jgi:3-isopropylmalate/(R)-2-methylmalate dehydratase large subunit
MEPEMPTMGQSMFDKIWAEHVIHEVSPGEFLLHIDRHFLHEISGAISLKAIDEASVPVRNPELTFATVDHVVDTFIGRGMTSKMPGGTEFLNELAARVARHQIRFFGIGDASQGIVHVIAPELGLVLPGMTFVCGDSHSCTVGGVGAFAWGIGSTDSEHVLATQTLIQTRPKTMLVCFEGVLPLGVYPKDLILALIGKHSARSSAIHGS